MRKLILIVHVTLDGYVADENGSFDNFIQSPENLEFVCSLTEKADAALVGRKSYEMLESFWPTARDQENATQAEITYSNWYNEAEKIVLSATLSCIKPNTTIISNDVVLRIREFKNHPGKNILMFGCPTAFETLNQHQLIDEYWVIQYPVLFGKGIPFFSRTKNLRRLKLLQVRQFSLGEIAIHYSS